MVRFIIVRHGLTTFNKLHIYQGQYDSPLAIEGYRQAEETGKHLASAYKIDAIYASDLSRTRRTAAPLSRILGLPVVTDPALREVDVGKWSGKKVSDAWREEPERVTAYRNDPGTFRFEGGESFEDVYRRASAFLEKVAKKHDGETVVIVSHGGTIRSLLCVWMGIPLKELRKVPTLKNTSITVADYDNGSVTLSLVGDNSHLPEKLR